ncbi:hypothetical protein M0R45_012776 [Rubus argutus]|uniref:SnoaL-like domain-containing protein n=1 Tax=Rubus argutus TaxID=59490 RepID=A0AAW1XG79_RUBAR
MALVPSPISANTITYSSTTRQISHINTLHRANNAFGNFHPPIVPVIQTRQKQLLVVPISRATNSPEAAGGGGGGDGDGNGQDPRALETVLKLYSAIKNKNVRELSEIIGDECQCVCNLSPIIQPLRGKKQVLDFFLSLIRLLGKDIEFIIRPTMHDGMNVGVQWSLEWNKKHVPLGKGFSFHISQHYKGKVIIKHVEMFMEPLLHIPLRMKMMGIMSAVMEKMGSNAIFKGGASKVVWIFLFLFITAAFLISLMLISH